MDRKEAKDKLINQKGIIINNKKGSVKSEIQLPKQGSLISDFVKLISPILSEESKLFYRKDIKDIVEVINNEFKLIKPAKFITLCEQYFEPGHWLWNDTKKKYYFSPKSMSADLANICLNSSNLQNSLKQIKRIFTLPLPIIYEGQITFPKKGYDERFNSWLLEDSPDIIKPNMALEEAKQILDNLYSEFCFKSDQDRINAISALLTPFLRGLFKSFNTRTPVFFYLANRERAGKDYCAGITGIVLEGNAVEESPISTSENNKSNHTEELRKKILSAFISGKKRMHFSNNKGYINNAVFEAIITSEKHTDRVLGKNELLTFDNELDFSLSGNVGVGFTADLANRCRLINLFLDIEDANARRFNIPNLHNWVKENRGLIISALYSLVYNWFTNGCPKGKVTFASFPEWAEICGGIMECAGYDSPCSQNQEILALGGDSETNDMKLLFEKAYEKHPGKEIDKDTIKNLILWENDSEIFRHLDLTSKSGQTTFGMLITKFTGRVLSDIRLISTNPDKRADRRKYKFVKDVGNLCNVGNLTTLHIESNKNNIRDIETLPKVPRLPIKEVTSNYLEASQ